MEKQPVTATPFDILGFGAITVDDLLYVDEYPRADTKVRVSSQVRQCGGLTGTALVAASRLGARCAYVGMLGNDQMSRFVAESLAREGVDINHSPRRDHARPGHATIIVGMRQKTRTAFSSIEGSIGADPEEPDEQLIRDARVLLIDHHGIEGSIRAARIARQCGVPVVADFERALGDRFNELLGLVDHPIVSRRFAEELTGLRDPSAAVTNLMKAGPANRVAVVTCGADGCWYCDSASGGPVHFPAFEVEVVDTTGCGDVFHGAYAASLALGEPLGRRIEFATATAAMKATQPGGQSGCPSRPAVEEFLAR
jgi:sulfofructose kinase